MTLRLAIALAWSALPSLQAEPIISEFMASNSDVLADGDGNYPDWIEMHNPDAVEIAEPSSQFYFLFACRFLNPADLGSHLVFILLPGVPGDGSLRASGSLSLGCHMFCRLSYL